MSQIVFLELWQPGTDEAHPSKGQVTDLTNGVARTATDQRHPPNRKPTDCDDSLSHIPAAAEIRTTEPAARDTSLTTRSGLESNTSSPEPGEEARATLPHINFQYVTAGGSH